MAHRSVWLRGRTAERSGAVVGPIRKDRRPNGIAACRETGLACISGYWRRDRRLAVTGIASCDPHVSRILLGMRQCLFLHSTFSVGLETFLFRLTRRYRRTGSRVRTLVPPSLLIHAQD